MHRFGDIKLYLLGCYMNPAVSCSTRLPNGAQTRKNLAGATRTLHSHVAPAIHMAAKQKAENSHQPPSAFNISPGES